jgi:hypothetical protein
MVESNHKVTISVATIVAIIASLGGSFGYQNLMPVRTPSSMMGMGDRLRMMDNAITKIQADLVAQLSYQERDRRELLERINRQDVRMENQERIAGTLATLVGKIEENTTNLRIQMTIVQAHMSVIMEKLGVVQGKSIAGE